MKQMMIVLAVSVSALPAGQGQEAEPQPAVDFKSIDYSALRARSIGPALMSGRVGDFAVDPSNPAHYFVAVCSGGVWKTTNGGATYVPVFDSQGSYSIGCLAMDPTNPNVVWVGTGENNSQRSVSFGDGVYRTLDGGKTWRNLGLKDSEHIGMIRIHPDNPDTVYVAAQGPLWRSGGDRGLYRTMDGGKSWDRILHVDDDTGINEVHLDPNDPAVIYASAYQRRRHVWTLINGGPSSAIYKSEDAGKTWRKLTRGIPGVDKGRIGMAVSPADPNVVYAIIEAARGQGGVFRSTDRGETWSKRSSYMTTSPQYYNEIFCDPKNVDRVYCIDTVMNVTEDGGRTFTSMSIRNKHVDDHVIWIDPSNTDHLLVGSDGGIYETFDRGRNWIYQPNLPITQFYRVSVDNSEPFYFVYGGTQDNNSQGGPSRTTNRAGITNDDWFVTVGGDGYETRVDPQDPNIVYSQFQYGGLVRHDRRTGQITDIKPREAPGEEPYRWNWDTPLIISPHQAKRLYFAANKLFRSEDGGVSWNTISPDLTRRIDRNRLKVMGVIQGPDAVAKHMSTSIFGNSVSLDESPLVEGLIYVGTDDGLIQVSEDGGNNWRKESLFPNVPDMTYISCLTASLHDPNTVFASFDNHKMGDFKPYLLKSADRGRNWESIAGDLPGRDIVYSIQQDHLNKDLLFAGTEFGGYFSLNGGVHWIKIGGVPTIAVRDIAIQRRENDVVLGTFGRGMYVLDDYSVLRHIDGKTAQLPGVIFPIKPALRYIPRSRLGGSGGRGSQGASYYSAANPPYGAVFTIYLKESLKTLREKRIEAASRPGGSGKADDYPTTEQLRREQTEPEPYTLLTVRDQAGAVVRRIKGPRSKGMQRLSWDLRYPSTSPPSAGGRFASGPLALPGKYTVELAKVVDGEVSALVEPTPFEVNTLGPATFEAKDRPAVLAFQKMVARLQGAVSGAVRIVADTRQRLQYLEQAFNATPGADAAILKEVLTARSELDAIALALSGDSFKRRLQEPTPPSINERIRSVVGGQWNVTSPPTETQKDAYRFAAAEFKDVLQKLRVLIETKIKAIEQRLEAAGAPWTPGRFPNWVPESP